MTADALLILALIQGLTEFLPVSSSAHLILFAHLSGREESLLLDVAAHLGTLLAALVFFRSEMKRLANGANDALRRRHTPDARLFSLIAIASLPAFLVGAGLMLSGLALHLRRPDIIAWTNIVFALLLFAADRFAQARRKDADMTNRQALLIGAAQACAFLPGASRMGATLSMTRALGFERESAARFALLLAVPAITGAAALGLIELAQKPSLTFAADALLVLGLSFAAGLLALSLFMRFAARLSVTPFVLYRLALGGAIILLAL